ncbi:glycosyltransferase family 39 protein [Streptomyces sp. NPDC002446]
MSLDLDHGPAAALARKAARSPTGTHRTAGRVAVGAPALLALALGLWGLSRQGAIWRDEAATWEVAQRSIPEIWHLAGQVDVVHWLYYLLIHTVFEVFGASLAALRLPSVLGLIVAVAATAATGRRLAGPLAGLSAGLVLALLPVMQRYAQEGRSFALVTAGVAVATWLLVGAVCPDGGRDARSGRPWRAAWAWRWGAYTAVMLVTGLLNWLSLFAVAAHGWTVLIAWRRGQRPLAARWLTAVVVIVAGTLPLILASRPQAVQVSWIQPASAASLLGVTAMLVVGVVCARVPRRAGAELSPVAVGLPLLAVPQLGLLLASWLVEPLYVDRYVLFSYTGLSLLVGTAVAWAVPAYGRARGRNWGRARRGTLLAGVVAVAFVALLPLELGLRAPTSRTDDVRVAAQRVAAVARPGDGVVFLPHQRRDAALVTPGAFSGLDDLALAKSPVDSGTLYGIEAAPERIRAAMLAHRRIVVVSDSDSAGGAGSSRVPQSPGDPVKRAVLARHFTAVSSVETGGRRVTVYERRR